MLAALTSIKESSEGCGPMDNRGWWSTKRIFLDSFFRDENKGSTRRLSLVSKIRLRSTAGTWGSFSKY